MSTGNRSVRYDEEFKRALVNLYQNGGKTQAALCKEYRVSLTSLTPWIKQYSSEPADRTRENQEIAKLILHIYSDYHKRRGAYKISYILQRDFGINISVGRVYRLMRALQLPRMSTDKPFHNYRHKDNGACTNHLHQEFNQKAPNIV